MKLKLTVGSCYCYAAEFKINDINADPEDFGEKYDRDPDHAPDYGCGDMQFTAIPPTKEVLKKYHITKAEYALIANQLEKELSFGCCDYCA